MIILSAIHYFAVQVAASIPMHIQSNGIAINDPMKEHTE